MFRKIWLFNFYIYYKNDTIMKKPTTKRKISLRVDTKVYDFLENFENKSKYIEYLIYKDIKDCGLLKKEIIL